MLNLLAWAESLLLLLPPWLIIVALVIELATVAQAYYWSRQGYALIRYVALIPLTASIVGLCLFYVVLLLDLPASLPLLQVVSRVILLVMTLSTVHLLAGYWDLTWRAWRDHR